MRIAQMSRKHFKISRVRKNVTRGYDVHGFPSCKIQHTKIVIQTKVLAACSEAKVEISLKNIAVVASLERDLNLGR